MVLFKPLEKSMGCSGFRLFRYIVIRLRPGSTTSTREHRFVDQWTLPELLQAQPCAAAAVPREPTGRRAETPTVTPCAFHHLGTVCQPCFPLEKEEPYWSTWEHCGTFGVTEVQGEQNLKETTAGRRRKQLEPALPPARSTETRRRKESNQQTFIPGEK